ncbi:MAG: hypothetical protein BJ554DRAFT_4327 [Olpidium bornovanus]|uniref:Yeast cell wall synthesis Kre9/Knh1-like N-terminal domain-containing protein n=1 Tax=Olpidium bornovanus TaxID=278681 RepID=A0A8H7ZMW4_9FUNG|nr:MAG: hypothetical protein BJ554DRAFT_4327 [Olpidium bornovanus]
MRPSAVFVAGAACVLGSALSARAGIAFTQPITGGTYDVGTQLIVAWTYSDANFTKPNTLTAILYLEKGKDANSMEIVDVIENLNNSAVKKGNYVWSIPTKYSSDNGYALRMVVENLISHTPVFSLNNPSSPLVNSPSSTSTADAAASPSPAGKTSDSGTAGVFASLSAATLFFAGVLGTVVANAAGRFL